MSNQRHVLRSQCGTYDYVMDDEGNTICTLLVPRGDQTEHERRVAEIVAVPELLAALPVVTQLFEDCIEGDAGEIESDREAIAAARAAIAKARGEAV